MGKLTDFSLSGYVGAQLAQPPADRTIPELVEYIGQQLCVGGEAAINAGKGLIEAKQKLKHGEWGDWLAENFGLSVRQAQRLMTLARNYGDSNATLVSHLGPSKALALLALPESERDTFVSEPHFVDGEEKTVIDMSVREMEKAIRDKEAALAGKAAAEDARDKMAEDMKAVKSLLDTAREERDTALEEAQERQKLLRASELEVSRLAQELDELKRRPVEVAVQIDQEAVEKAKADAVAEMQKKLDKAQAEKDRLAVARDEAEERRKSAEEALSTARYHLANVLNSQEPSPIAADAVLAQFGVYLEQAQEIANKMRGLLLKVRAREDCSTAEKLEKALRALGEKIGGAAQ